MPPYQIQSWLEQFSLVDQEIALSLLKSLRPIGEENLKNGIKRELLKIADKYPKKKEGVHKLMTPRHLCAIKLHERKTAMP